MIEAANIREWRGHDVVDAKSQKIGELEAVYVDTVTDLPSFGTVKVGVLTRQRLVFVPLDQTTVGPEYVKVSTTPEEGLSPCHAAAQRRGALTRSFCGCLG